MGYDLQRWIKMKYGIGQESMVNGVGHMLSSSTSFCPSFFKKLSACKLIYSYSDWIALNEPRLIILRRTTDPLDLSRYAEAIGDIMRLNLTIDQPNDQVQDNLPEIKSDIPTSKLLPPIKFHGSSEQHTGIHALQGNGSPSSFVRGVVQLTADNPPQVRWTLVIRYGGEDRWRLECVQVGGRGSRRGFFGVSHESCAARADHCFEESC